MWGRKDAEHPMRGPSRTRDAACSSSLSAAGLHPAASRATLASSPGGTRITPSSPAGEAGSDGMRYSSSPAPCGSASADEEHDGAGSSARIYFPGPTRIRVMAGGSGRGPRCPRPRPGASRPARDRTRHSLWLGIRRGRAGKGGILIHRGVTLGRITTFAIPRTFGRVAGRICQFRSGRRGSRAGPESPVPRQHDETPQDDPTREPRPIPARRGEGDQERRPGRGEDSGTRQGWGGRREGLGDRVVPHADHSSGLGGGGVTLRSCFYHLSANGHALR